MSGIRSPRRQARPREPQQGTTMGPVAARGAREAGLGAERGRRRYANGNGG